MMKSHPHRARSGVVAAAVITAIAVAGCGQYAAPSDVHHQNAQPVAAMPEVPSSLSISAQVPPGFDPIEQLVGDPTGAGVWFWSDNGVEARIFRVDPQGTMASWVVLSGNAFAPRIAKSGLAVDPSGSVWLGINSSLIALDPTSGIVRHWPIPTPRDNPAAESHLPPAPFKLRGVHAVQALATGPTKTIAIAMSNSSSVVIFNDRTEAFTSNNLPSENDQPLSAAYDADGLLAIGISDLSQGGQAQHIVLVDPNATKTVRLNRAGSAWELALIDDSTFVAGSITPDVVSASGTVTPLALPAPLVGSAAAPTPVAVLPGNMLAGIIRGGVLEFPRPGGTTGTESTRKLLTPKSDCANLASRDDATSSQATVTTSSPTCPRLTIDDLASDGAGNLWISGPNGRGVSLLTAG